MILTFCAGHNHIKSDATGAFIPEARRFALVHAAPPPVLFDNTLSMARRLRQVLDVIDACETPVSTLALFCHGWKDGLQVGVRNESAWRLAAALRRVADPAGLRVLLFCCHAARDDDDDELDDLEPGPGGDGGFADMLRDALRVQGVAATIYAHAARGHTTHCPYVRRFDPGEMAGGHWVIEPTSALFPAWKRALRGELRFRFPFMSQLEIEAELRRGDRKA